MYSNPMDIQYIMVNTVNLSENRTMLPNHSHAFNPNPSGYTLLELPAKVEYALMALMELATHRNAQEPLTIGAIAARQPIPERYLEQILSILRRSGILQSHRGAKGGYVLVREPWKLTILEVINLLDRAIADTSPSLPAVTASANLRSSVERHLVYEVWQQADAASRVVLSQYTLQDLCERRDDRKRDDFMYYI